MSSHIHYSRQKLCGSLFFLLLALAVVAFAFSIAANRHSTNGTVDAHSSGPAARIRGHAASL
jgi:hypothetical protein